MDGPDLCRQKEILGSDKAEPPRRPSRPSLFDENGSPKVVTIVVFVILLFLFVFGLGVMEGRRQVWQEAVARNYARWNLDYEWNDKWVRELQYEKTLHREEIKERRPFQNFFPITSFTFSSKVFPMWLFTKYGFYSAVCARTENGEYGQPVDTNRIMVRARLTEHLENLKNRFHELLGDCEIKEYAGSDYACRIFLPKSVWSKVVEQLASETDYDNFKSEVARYLGKKGEGYEHSLLRVWNVMYQLQK